MKYVLAFAFLLCSLCFMGQYDRYVQQGDKSFDRLEINGALLKYLSAYEDTAKQEVVKKIALSYYVLGEFEKAEEWYFRLFTYPDQQPKDYLEYITCLAYLGEKEKSFAFLGYLKEYFPDYQLPPTYEFWLNKRFNDPCKPDVAKNTKISYCIDFDASRSIDSGNTSVSFRWDLDDGTVYKGPRCKHCFKKPGNHEVKLSAIDSSLGYSRVSDTVFTVSFVEEANFKLGGSHEIGQNVNFYGYNLTQHPDYYGMVWEISDGTLHFKEAFTHKFYHPSTYSITLHVFGKNDNNEIYQVACLTQNWNISRNR